MSTTNVETGKGTKDTEHLKKIDFKMISFTLAGRDYGIDILKVKEIRKAGNFTKVPNTPVFVRGVDNLRGDIIPIIDLRTMFNLPAETKDPASLENIVIIRLDALILGIVVDTIEKVVGISHETIQPPHPIFGDINIQYINGVVENEGRLYIILDVDRIFGDSEPVPTAVASASVNDEGDVPLTASAPAAATGSLPLDLQFVAETLAAFGQFHLSPVNQDWVTKRLGEWKSLREAKGLDFQLTLKEEAQEFLAPFASRHTGQVWAAASVAELSEILKFDGSQIAVWNPGCGRGYESYSLALLLQTRFSKFSYKIWASDHDLLNISTAPALVLDEDSIDLEWKEFTVQSKNGLQFSTDLKGHVLFEFHDVNHTNPMPEIQLAVLRDLLSYLKVSDQEKLISELSEKLKPGGYLILGDNEKLQNSEWKDVSSAGWSVYQKLESVTDARGVN